VTDPLAEAIAARNELHASDAWSLYGKRPLTHTYKCGTHLDACIDALQPAPAPSGVWRWDAGSAKVTADSAARVAAFQSYAVAAGTYFEAAVAWAVAPAGTASYAIPVTGQTVKSITAPVPLGTKPGCTFDQSLYVIGPDGTEYDFGLAQYDSATRKIKTTDGAAPVAPGAVAETGPGSGNAARFPLSQGPVTPANVASGVIDHPLVITIPNVGPAPNPYPANTTYGYPNNTGVPLGTWLRLDPSVNVAALGLPKLEAMLAVAMQKYGMFVRDIGSTLCVIATDQVNQGGNASDWPAVGVPLEAKTPSGVPYAHALSPKFPWAKLQVLNPPAPQAPTPVVPRFELTLTPNFVSGGDPPSTNYQSGWVYATSPTTPYVPPNGRDPVSRHLLLDPRLKDSKGNLGSDEWWFVVWRYWPSSFDPDQHGEWGTEFNLHNVAGDSGPAGSGGVGWGFGSGVSALGLLWLKGEKSPELHCEPVSSGGHSWLLQEPTRDAWHEYLIHFVAGRTDGTTARAGLIECWADGQLAVDAASLNTVQRANGYTQAWAQGWDGDYTRALPKPSTVRFGLTGYGRTRDEALADVPRKIGDNLGTTTWTGVAPNLGPPTLKALT
jgi:hypothetical protein